MIYPPVPGETLFSALTRITAANGDLAASLELIQGNLYRGLAALARDYAYPKRPGRLRSLRTRMSQYRKTQRGTPRVYKLWTWQKWAADHNYRWCNSGRTAYDHEVWKRLAMQRIVRNNSYTRFVLSKNIAANGGCYWGWTQDVFSTIYHENGCRIMERSAYIPNLYSGNHHHVFNTARLSLTPKTRAQIRDRMRRAMSRNHAPLLATCPDSDPIDWDEHSCFTESYSEFAVDYTYEGMTLTFPLRYRLREFL